MDPKTLAMIFEQIIKGWDIPEPSKLLKISQERACTTQPNHPYTFAENLWHTIYWQNLWIDQLQGNPTPDYKDIWAKDWQTPKPDDLKQLSEEFNRGLETCLKICQATPFSHKMESDDKACETLARVAIHASYHIGQLKLIKRSLSTPSEEDED